MMGIQKGQDIPADMMDEFNRTQAMVEAVANGVKARKHEHTNEHRAPQEGQQSGQPQQNTAAQASSSSEPPPPAETAGMDTNGPPDETEEPAAKNLKRDIRGSPTGGSCP